jgi:hypothetical protein
MQRETDRLIEHYRVPISTMCLALFNPRYTDEERQRRLACFSVWWQALWVLRAGRCPEQVTALRVGHPTSNNEREVLAIELLSGYIDAANRGADPSRYAGVLHPLRGSRPESELELLLRQVFDALMGLQYEDLQAMQLTLSWIDDVATTRCARAE